MKNFDIVSFDGLTLKGWLFDNIVNPKGVVQITHGMAEHGKRYFEFAEFLNANGYVVYVYDQRGHGETCGNVQDVGKVGSGDNFIACVKDQGEVSCALKELYPKPKFIVFGHSYGSFLTQKYIQTYDFADKAIICGSSMMTGFLPSVGKLIASVGGTFKGKDAKAHMIANMSFGGYEKHFAKLGETGKNSWLSRDTAQVQKYNDDEYCGSTFSFGFYKSFFNGFTSLYTDKGLAKINKSMPILLISGSEDPVGDYSKGVENLCKKYLECNLNVEMKLFPEMRHEILNEIGNEEVYNSILTFIEK